MRTRLGRSPAALLGCVGSIVILVSCASDKPIGPLAEQVSVCHVTGTTGAIIDVPRSELATHLGAGDYLTNLAVNHAPGEADAEHFHRILDALTAARTGRLARNEMQSAACRITITVSSGVYHGSAFDSSDTSVEWLPLVVDVPDITLRGALVMQLDGNGRATGVGTSTKVTTIAPKEPLANFDDGTVYPIILADGHPGGSAGNGLTVQGFAFRSGWGAIPGSASYAIFSMRVVGLSIVGNRFEHGFDVPLDLRATSAVITQNQISGTGLCDMCIAGPGVYQVTGNLLLAGALEGILTTPVIDLDGTPQAEPYQLPAEAEVSGDISNNEVHDHLLLPVGTAIRIGAIGLGGPFVPSSSHFTVHNNLLVNNRFAMLIEGSFPEVGSQGDLDVDLGGNIMQQSCQANLLVAFARHTTALGLKDEAYIQNSTYTLTLGGDVQWQDVWFSHPAGYGNTLVVDGTTIDNGQRAFYSEDSCPGLAASPRSTVASVR